MLAYASGRRSKPVVRMLHMWSSDCRCVRVHLKHPPHQGDLGHVPCVQVAVEVVILQYINGHVVRFAMCWPMLVVGEVSLWCACCTCGAVNAGA